MTTTKTGNWRLDYDWTNKEDHPVDEATEDCKSIIHLSSESPFEDYETNVIQLKEIN
jgi:hypothetical protein|tara:strand:- start:288 stop:458 length:171 start_codon:yes stop_codon:yes gene_type:complete